MKILIKDPQITSDMLKPATKGSAGIDLLASIAHFKLLYAGESYVVHTGIQVSIPKGWVGLVIPRSGLGAYSGIVLGNLVGAIDSDYRGEILVPVWNRNFEGKAYRIDPYHRIAQLLVVPHYLYDNVEFVTGKLDTTDRDDSGFGSSGL